MKSITVPGSLDSLEVIRRHVQEAAENAGLDRDSSYRLCLAVDEVATNIITHGYSEAGLAGEVEVEAGMDAENLTISLGDTGTAFDPRTAVQPDVDLPAEARGVGGLGVYLAIRNVDGFRYERDAGRNRNVFIMKRRKG